MRRLMTTPLRPLLLAVLVTLLAVAAGSAVAAQTATHPLYYACLTAKGGVLYHVNTSALPTCNRGDTAITWNQPGPALVRGGVRADGSVVGPASSDFSVTHTAGSGRYTISVPAGTFSGTYMPVALITPVGDPAAGVLHLTVSNRVCSAWDIACAGEGATGSQDGSARFTVTFPADTHFTFLFMEG